MMAVMVSFAVSYGRQWHFMSHSVCGVSQIYANKIDDKEFQMRGKMGDISVSYSLNRDML